MASALLAGDVATARGRFAALSAGLVLVPDHEPGLFEGVFVPRSDQPRPGRVAFLVRSWEQFDRAFERVEESCAPEALAAAETLRERVLTLLRRSGLAGLAEDHLFVQYEGALAPMVLSADDTLRDALREIATNERAEEAFRALRLLDPCPHE